MIFYFSGTGNSKWIAQETAKIGFVFPIYSWGPPAIVLDFVRRLQLKTDHTNYIFFICTCGDDIGLSKDIFVKALSAKGFVCNSGFSVIMPNNYILMKGFNVDPKSLEEKKLNESIDRVQQINERLSDRITGLFDCKRGNFPFFKTRIIWPLFNKYQISDKAFFATDSCNGCKLCEKICPVNNIKVNKKPEWEHHCTLCLACIHKCPQTAIQYGKETQKKGRYYFGKK